MADTAHYAWPIVAASDMADTEFTPKVADFQVAVDAAIYTLDTGKQNAAARLAAIVATGVTLSMFASGVVNTGALANTTTTIPSEATVKAYADSLFASNDALLYKGAINASTNPNYPAADAGHTYRITVAGKLGGASGVNVEVGDLATCFVDSSAAGNQATVGANWNITQNNLDGAVIGPASSVAGRIATFSGTSGKIIQDSGYTIDQSLATTSSPTFAGLTISGTGVFTNATSLSFERASHDVWRILQGTPSSTRGIGLYNNTDAAYGWFVSDTENVGVGTTDPSAKLHVNGILKVGNANSTSAHADLTLDSHDNYASLIRYYQGGGLRWMTGRGISSSNNHYEITDGSGVQKFRIDSGNLATYVQAILPRADNTYQNGDSSARWTTVFATTGSINTSDMREKTPFAAVNENERAFARDVFMGAGWYRWLASVAEKGSKARAHFGLGAQVVEKLAKKHGLNPNAMALFCEDEITETISEPTGEFRDPEKKGGKKIALMRDVTRPLMKDGKPYVRKGLRPDQLHSLGIATLFHELKSMRAELNELRKAA